MHISADLVAQIYLWSIISLWFAPMCTLILLGEQLDYCRDALGKGLLIPTRAGRYTFAVYYWWAWTKGYRLLGNATATRLVFTTRALTVLAILAGVALFALPPDLAERIAAALNRN